MFQFSESLNELIKSNIIWKEHLKKTKTNTALLMGLVSSFFEIGNVFESLEVTINRLIPIILK